MTTRNDVNGWDQQYLFSACIPSTFEQDQIVHICKEVADGNDYKDYLLNDDETSTSRWKTSTSAWMVIVIIISVIMSIVCGLSCFYNYKVFKTGD